MTMANGDGWASGNPGGSGSSLVVSESGAGEGEECKVNLRSAAAIVETTACLDGEREACSTSQLLRVPTKQMRSTLQDLSNMEEQYEDEDDDDSDWESVMRLISKKWFCTNCTMPNFDDACYCDMCGEYKDSKILIHGCFASHLAEEDKTTTGSEVKERCQAILLPIHMPMNALHVRQDLQLDVHHGNGTQEIFESNKSVLYISLHRHENGRFYPGTGAAEEAGIKDAEGYCVNIPWKTGGVGDNDYIFAFQRVVLPIVVEFAPDFTIISAGFDAARGDPLGCCNVTPDGYAQMTRMLNNLSQGKLLVVLEGGYNLHSISSSATAVIKVLLGDEPTCEMNGILPTRAGLQTLLEVLSIQMKFWPIWKSNYDKLQLQWDSIFPAKRKKDMKRRRNLIGPIWWKWSSKRLVYIRLYGKKWRQYPQLQFLLGVLHSPTTGEDNLIIIFTQERGYIVLSWPHLWTRMLVLIHRSF